jgi:histidinol dehydrogenase
MKTYNKPTKEQWAELAQRPIINKEQLTKSVNSIIDGVMKNGDSALIKYAIMFNSQV